MIFANCSTYYEFYSGFLKLSTDESKDDLLDFCRVLDVRQVSLQEQAVTELK
jgi:hypothetical protein